MTQTATGINVIYSVRKTFYHTLSDILFLNSNNCKQGNHLQIMLLDYYLAHASTKIGLLWYSRGV
jgi:hypothetical protein